MSKEKETGKEKGRIRQLARYYIPYKGLFFTDMFFAMLGAAITLVIPLIDGILRVRLWKSRWSRQRVRLSALEC